MPHVNQWHFLVKWFLWHVKTLLCVQVLFCNIKISSDISEAEMGQWKEKTTRLLFERCYCGIKWFLLLPEMNQHNSKFWDLVKIKIKDTESRGEMAKEATYFKDNIWSIDKEHGVERNFRASLFLIPCPVKWQDLQGWSNRQHFVDFFTYIMLGFQW